LRYLNISENAFAVLPECVTGMVSLIELRASDNQLTSLPDSVKRLSSLRELHLRNNRLTTLPGWIATLERRGWQGKEGLAKFGSMTAPSRSRLVKWIAP
jgi:Leucine-rich repeat (LRR) protein